MNESSTVEIFQFYYTPTLVYLGSIGNLLSVYIFLSPKLRKLTSSYYLSALAVSDTIFLMALFIVWLTMIDIDLFNQPGTCQIIVYITSMCSFLSVWFVVAFTIERFVAVQYPLLRHSICTAERAKLVLLCLVIFALILFSPLLLFAGTHISRNNTLCRVQPELQKLAAAFNIADTILTFIIPVITIVVLNICICRAVLKLDNTRRKLTVKRTIIFSRDVRTIKHTEYAGTQTKITKMLLLVSSIFLCFNLPSYIMRVLAYLIEFQILKDVNLLLFLNVQHWCQQFFNTNFGVNFVLYCIGGQNFRKAVKTRLCPKKISTPLTRSESRGHSTSTSKSSTSKRNRPGNHTIVTDVREVFTYPNQADNV